MVRRWIATRFRAALKASPVVILTGARQVGKTTLARLVGHGRTYHTLDDFGVLEQAHADPDSLTAQCPVTIDEVQRAPTLMLAIKRRVDRKRRPGDFVLTGSANLALMSKVSESLAGRAIYFDLAPFCPAEWNQRETGLTAIDDLFESDLDVRRWPKGGGDWGAWLLRGGFPPALLADGDDERDLWFGGYVSTYLERDLRQISAVSSLPDFQRLMRLAANRSARLLNVSELARDAGLTQPTCHRYMNLLETGFMITRLQPYTTNPATALVKSKKLMWNDCGLAAWLAGLRSAKELSARLDRGFWLEQAIFQTLQVWRAIDPTRRRIHFWRDRSGREVDFVLERDSELVAIEIKASSQASPRDADGIVAFGEHLPSRKTLRRGVVLHGGQARSLRENVVALPWGWMFPTGES